VCMYVLISDVCYRDLRVAVNLLGFKNSVLHSIMGQKRGFGSCI
jgi:hypothetical protein